MSRFAGMVLAGVVASFVGCGHSEEPSGRLASTETSEAASSEAEPHEHGDHEHGDHAHEAAPAQGTSGTFGRALDASIALTALSDILADPDRFEGTEVRTEGTIARVCQARGCWMELRAGEDDPGVRVPMAGHAFFIPMDSAGRHATMQGRVIQQALAPDVRAHLESEGAVATTSTLSIEASGVVID